MWRTRPKDYGVNGWTLPLLCPRRTVPGSIPGAPAEDPAGSPLWPRSKTTLVSCSSGENHAAKQAWIQWKLFRLQKRWAPGLSLCPRRHQGLAGKGLGSADLERRSFGAEGSPSWALCVSERDSAVGCHPSALSGAGKAGVSIQKADVGSSRSVCTGVLRTDNCWIPKETRRSQLHAPGHLL